MLRTKNNVVLRMRQTLLSLCMILVLSLFGTGFAQVSIIDQLADFVKNSSIEFMINGQKVGQQIPVYAENQDVGFSILSQTSGYHYLYVVSGEGSSSLIYPNEFENQAFIQAGTQTNFPSNNAYRFIAQSGQGTDFHIVSIVSPTPLTGFTIGFTNGFNIIPPATQVIPVYQAAAMRYRVQASSQSVSSCANNCVNLSANPVLVQTPVFTPSGAVTATPATSTAGAFQGFATYQDYLDNYYSQNNTVQNNTTSQQAVTTAPAVTPVPVTPTYSVPNYAAPTYAAGTFQGFASYQAYLDNYYAQNGGQANSNQSSQTSTQTTNQAVTTAPSMTSSMTPVTVYTTLVGSGTSTTPAAQTIVNQAATSNSGAFQGFASYQDYLDNFYSQNGGFSAATGTTNTQVQQPVETDPFLGFGSYEAYLANFQATSGLTTAVGATTSPTTTANNYSVYNVVPTPTTQAPSYAVNYSVYQQQLQNGYTQLSPLPVTQPINYPVTTVNTDYSQPGFFDFEVGRDYTLFQSVGLKVLSIQDNRCPQGVQCVQAGNIVTTVEIQFANVRRSFTITILPGDEPTIGVGNTSLRFIGLSDASSTALRVNVATR